METPGVEGEAVGFSGQQDVSEGQSTEFNAVTQPTNVL